MSLTKVQRIQTVGVMERNVYCQRKAVEITQEAYYHFQIKLEDQNVQKMGGQMLANPSQQVPVRTTKSSQVIIVISLNPLTTYTFVGNFLMYFDVQFFLLIMELIILQVNFGVGSRVTMRFPDYFRLNGISYIFPIQLFVLLSLLNFSIGEKKLF